MSRSDLAAQTCTLAQAVSLIGDEWSILILRELFLGTRRFDEFGRQTGMSSHLLSVRLKKMEKAGILRRRAYSERPTRYEYHLTEMGRGLWPVVVSLKQWGDQWLGDGETHVHLEHKSCGQISRPRMTCDICGEPMTAVDAKAHLSDTYAGERHARRKTS